MATKKKPSTARRRPTAAPKRRKSVREKYIAVNGECTLELVDKLSMYVQMGMPVDRACDLCGVSRERYSKWIKFGEDYLEAPEREYELMSEADRERGEVYAALYLGTTSAAAMFLRNVQDDLKESTGRMWKRAISVLERRDPRNWARVRARPIGVGEELGEQFTPDESFL